MHENRYSVSYLPLLFSFNPSLLLKCLSGIRKKVISSLVQFSRVLPLIFFLPLIFSCKESPDSTCEISNEFFGEIFHKNSFWNHIDTAHILLESRRYSQAKVRLLKAKSFAESQLEFDIIELVYEKVNTQGRKSRMITQTSYQNEIDPYLRSLNLGDLMLAYNYAAKYVEDKIGEKEHVEFPGPLIKRQHVVFFKVTYRIRSYVDIYTESGEKVRGEFNCEIRLYKDRVNYSLKSLEIII